MDNLNICESLQAVFNEHPFHLFKMFLCAMTKVLGFLSQANEDIKIAFFFSCFSIESQTTGKKQGYVFKVVTIVRFYLASEPYISISTSGYFSMNTFLSIRQRLVFIAASSSVTSTIFTRSSRDLFIKFLTAVKAKGL